jgi:hypothetical protein
MENAALHATKMMENAVLYDDTEMMENAVLYDTKMTLLHDNAYPPTATCLSSSCQKFPGLEFEFDFRS